MVSNAVWGSASRFGAVNCAYWLLKVVSSAVVLRPSATEPVVPEPVSGLVVVMPVSVPFPAPVPGNVWPGAKVRMPLLLTERSVELLPFPGCKSG